MSDSVLTRGRTFIRVAFMAAATTAALLVGPVARAAENDNNASISVGAFVTDWRSDARLRGSRTGARSSDVDLEKDLGVSASDTVFRIDGYYRFNPRHRLDASIYDFTRSSRRTLERDITWEDETFPVDAAVDFRSELGIYRLAYTYSVLTSERGFLGVSGGLYTADIKLRLAVTGERLEGRVAGGSATAPLPVVGLRGESAITDRWTVRGSAEFFYLEYGDYEGSLADVHLGIDYRMTDHLALGVALNGTSVDLDINRSRFNAQLDWEYLGGLIYLKVDF
jgi:hypothetical protein